MCLFPCLPDLVFHLGTAGAAQALGRSAGSCCISSCLGKCSLLGGGGEKAADEAQQSQSRLPRTGEQEERITRGSPGQMLVEFGVNL